MTKTAIAMLVLGVGTGLYLGNCFLSSFFRPAFFDEQRI
jgi:hypothetical protein